MAVSDDLNLLPTAVVTGTTIGHSAAHVTIRQALADLDAREVADVAAEVAARQAAITAEAAARVAADAALQTSVTANATALTTKLDTTTASATYVLKTAAGTSLGSSYIDGTGTPVIDFTGSPFWRRTNGTTYGPTSTPESGSDVQVISFVDETGTLSFPRPGEASISTLTRVKALEAAAPATPVLSRNAGAWPASTALPANTMYQLPTGGLGYLTTARTTRAAFDATERAFWTFLPGGHYEKITSTSQWVCPLGIVSALLGLVGGGGGGAGGGAASSAITQVGGGAGGGGAANRFEVTGLVAATGYQFVIGAAGTAGAGGAAAGGAGTNGGAGGVSTFVGPGGTTYSANGGGGGVAGGANSTTAVSAGTYGLAQTIATAFIPGCGGTASTGAGNAATTGPGGTIGGGGGGPSSTTLGGLGGFARSAPGISVGQQTGKTATTAGGNGASPTELGCGGAGGNGAAATAGYGEMWF